MSNPPTLHALLVGINEYHPQSGVNPLVGPHADIEAVKDFLRGTYVSRHFKKPKIHLLKDTKATYTEVIRQFYKKLCLAAKPGDVALFHFSGHGSYNITAEAFWPLSDSMRQDETLVCYDSRLDDAHQDLSDKELAVLISQFQPGVEVVILADSCFSGSITRVIEEDELPIGVKARHQPRHNGKPRALDAYFSGKNIPTPLQSYYVRQQQAGTLSVPESAHIVLMACDREQKAYESVEGGYFTQILMGVLEKTANRPVSYKELFQRMRVGVQHAKGLEQTPKFDVFGSFNSKRHFLLPTSDSGKGEHFVEYREGEWRMHYGAVHGMAMPKNASGAAKNRLSLLLLPIDQPEAEPLYAYATAVRMAYTVLQIDNLEGFDTRSNFYAEIIGMADPIVQFYVEESNPFAIDFIAETKRKAPLLDFTGQKTEARYALTFETITKQVNDKIFKLHQVSIVHLASGLLVHGANALVDMPVSLMVDYITPILKQVEKWERLFATENPETQLKDQVSWWVELKRPSGEWVRIDDKHCTVDFDGKNGVPFNIKCTNQSPQNLYVSLFWFNNDYTVIPLVQQDFKVNANTAAVVVFGTDLNSQVVLNTGPDGQPYPLESYTKLKILVSTKPLDNFLFEEKDGVAIGIIETLPARNIGGLRGTVDLAPQNYEDWFTQNMILRVVKTSGNLQQGLTNGEVSIMANAALNSPVSIGTIARDAPMQAILAEKEMELFNFKDAEMEAKVGTRTASAIEIGALPLGKLDQALQIKVGQNMGSGDLLAVPLAYDTENDLILPFGDVVASEEGNAIAMERLPDTSQEKSRNVGRAIVFGLLKIGFKVEVFWLRAVDYGQQPVRYLKKQADIRQKVETAHNILLVVHGYLGNTGKEAESFRPAVEKKQFDLVLAFDYENLNSTVVEIASKLQETLEQAGLGHGDGKHLTVVAHSLGGLVARYWIENLAREQDTVDQLVLVGTPNDGCAWGKASDWANMLNTTLSLLLNVFTGQIKPALSRLQNLLGAAKTDESLKTLAEMKPGSDVLKTLAGNAKPKHTRYIAVAGDALRYKNEENPNDGLEKHRIKQKFRLLWDKLSYIASGWFYDKNEPHDCFSTVKSQLELPFETEKHIVPAYHHGYFDYDALQGSVVLPFILSNH